MRLYRFPIACCRLLLLLRLRDGCAGIENIDVPSVPGLVSPPLSSEESRVGAALSNVTPVRSSE